MLDSIPSDRYVADKRLAEDTFSVCQHSRKPLLCSVNPLTLLITMNENNNQQDVEVIQKLT